MYRVLIAEDEIWVREGLRRSIDWPRLGMEVIAAAADGADAWDIYRTAKPDLILTDIRMPNMDGLQLIGRIREQDTQTPILILTCMEEFDLVRQALALGVTDYMLKLAMAPEQMEQALLKMKERMDEERNRVPSLPSAYGQVWLDTMMRDYLFRRLYTAEEFGKLLERAGKPFSNRKLLLLLMEIDQFPVLQRRFKDEQGDLIRSSLLNVLHEILDSVRPAFVFYLEPRRYIILLSLHDLHSEQKMEQFLAGLTEEIRRAIRTFFRVTVTFGAGPVRSGYERIPGLYAEGSELLDYKYALGSGRLIRMSDGRPEQAHAAVDEQLDRLSRHMPFFGDKGFRDQFDGKLAAYRQRENRHLRSAMHTLLGQLLQLPIVYFAMTDEEADAIVFTAQERLGGCETLEEAAAVFSGAMDELARRRESGAAFSEPVASAIRIIHREYRTELTLSSLAARIAMSPNYFGTLFKRETGISVIDYVNRYRIGVSKSLMASTRLKTYEIAERVGFSDHSYFSRVFRKETGCNPKDYRRYLSAAPAEEH